MDKQTNLFRLEEMQEAMELSIENAKKVLHEQEELKTLVENNQEQSSVDFTSFLKDTETQIKQMNEQIDVLQKRQELLKKTIEEMKNNKAYEKIGENLLNALGVFKQ